MHLDKSAAALALVLVVQGIVIGGGGEGGIAWGHLGSGQVQSPYSYSLPGYWMLQQEPIRKEIEIVPEQEAELQQLGMDYRKKLQELYVPLSNRELGQEERLKLYREMQSKTAELQKEVAEKVKTILLPHQLQALEQVELRTKLSGMLQNISALDRVGLSDEQKERLKQNRAELAKKLNLLQREAFADVLEILTPEQIEKLKQPWGQVALPADAKPAR